MSRAFCSKIVTAQADLLLKGVGVGSGIAFKQNLTIKTFAMTVNYDITITNN